MFSSIIYARLKGIVHIGSSLYSVYNQKCFFCKIVYKQFLKTKLHLPYIPGFLAFREVEPLLKLIKELKINQPEFYPQVILVDGNTYTYKLVK